MIEGQCKNELEEAEAFRLQALKEIERERGIGEVAKAPQKGGLAGWFMALIFLAVALYLLLVNPVVFLLWLIVAFILRSFYWFSWFMPTIKDRADQREKEPLKLSRERLKGPVKYILKHKKMLGVEIGVTMLVTGMAPLAISNFILFGIGIALGIYYGLVMNLYDYGQTLSILFQMSIIMVTFVIMIFLRPHERGLVKTVRRIKGGYISAIGRGRFAAYLVLAMGGIVVALIGIIFVVSMFAPGGTWQAIWDKLQENGFRNLFLLVFVLITELVLLRHFQGISSKRMVVQYLRNRMHTIEETVVAPLDKAISQAKASGATTLADGVLDEVKTNYYSIVIYDVYEHNLFGFSRVFVVGPRVTLLLNEEALRYIH
jgi:hypothetical protein